MYLHVVGGWTITLCISCHQTFTGIRQRPLSPLITLPHMVSLKLTVLLIFFRFFICSFGIYIHFEVMYGLVFYRD